MRASARAAAQLRRGSVASAAGSRAAARGPLPAGACGSRRAAAAAAAPAADDAYSLLGIKQGATKEEAAAAYRKLAKQWHPDTNSDPAAEGRFKEVSEAYQQIKDGGDGCGPVKRSGCSMCQMSPEERNRLFQEMFGEERAREITALQAEVQMLARRQQQTLQKVQAIYGAGKHVQVRLLRREDLPLLERKVDPAQVPAHGFMKHTQIGGGPIMGPRGPTGFTPIEQALLHPAEESEVRDVDDLREAQEKLGRLMMSSSSQERLGDQKKRMEQGMQMIQAQAQQFGINAGNPTGNPIVAAQQEIGQAMLASQQARMAAQLADIHAVLSAPGGFVDWDAVGRGRWVAAYAAEMRGDAVQAKRADKQVNGDFGSQTPRPRAVTEGAPEDDAQTKNRRRLSSAIHRREAQAPGVGASGRQAPPPGTPGQFPPAAARQASAA